jgi:hypothetical protein
VNPVNPTNKARLSFVLLLSLIGLVTTNAMIVLVRGQ